MGTDVWHRNAAQWERIGPPLRPGPQDVAAFEGIAEGWAARHARPPRALLLGVTPEIARMRWPPGTALVAVDRDASMIARVWPGFPGPGAGAIRGDWLRMPLARRSRTLVVSDACFTVIRFPGPYRTVLRAVREVLQPGGIFAFRAFLQPEPRDTPGAVYGDLAAGRIGGFHAFKLRLLMALQPDAAAGVRTGDVWTSWSTAGPRPEDLSARLGWPLEQIATIEAHRGQDVVYSFPSLRELRALLAEEGFVVEGCSFPAYELGERCPTIVCAPAP